MSDNTNFSKQDFDRSGINKDVYLNYYSQNYIEEEQDGYSISSTTVQNAIKLSQYFIRSFESIANVSVNNDGNGLTNFALNYIKTKNLKTISPSQLHRSNTSRYRCIEQARQVLSNLANLGYGRLCKGKKKGQTFIFYK